MENKIIKQIVIKDAYVITDKDFPIEPITFNGQLWFQIGKVRYNSRFVLSVEYK